MNVLCIVPARSGSKRCPGKNWEKVGGKTLLQRALDSAPLGHGNHVVIVSDAPDRCPTHEQGTTVAVYAEPSELASDATPMRKVVEWVCSKWIDSGNRHTRSVLVLQPSSPFRELHDSGWAIDIMERSWCDSVVSVVQDLKTKEYRRNGAIYLSAWDVAARGFLGCGWTQLYVMPAHSSIDIDTPEDLTEARRLAGDL